MTDHSWKFTIIDMCWVLPVPSSPWRPKVWTSWEVHSPSTETGKQKWHQKCSLYRKTWTSAQAICKNVRGPHKIDVHKEISPVLWPYLMEKGRQEKDSRLADYFATSFPEQWLVKVAAINNNRSNVLTQRLQKQLEDNSCACLFCHSFQMITLLHYW